MADFAYVEGSSTLTASGRKAVAWLLDNADRYRGVGGTSWGSGTSAEAAGPKASLHRMALDMESAGLIRARAGEVGHG